MKVSLSWLQEYVTVTATVDQLADLLTMAGLEVESVEDRYLYLNDVVVGHIEKVVPHPNADKLKLCQVRTDQGSVQVVCGAPNAAEGLLVPLALPGCRLSDALTVKETVIRGESSHGMLCSEAELGLGPDRSGLMVLPADGGLTVGCPLNKAMALCDPVLDISLTPNRADCLSILGIAREIAGFQGDSLRRPALELPETRGDIKQMTSVTVQAPDHCPRYAVRLVEGVTVAPSPFWLQDRLLSVGLRPINNIVDITNYILMETGQPLHAFDFDFLSENRITVRNAAAGEPFVTLDEKERRLEQDMLMICDGQKPVAIGGVMGGLNSEITDRTRRVLIESAYFSPASVRLTAKRLGLSTDASHRFERGVDPNGTLYALDRAAQLTAQLGRGQLINGTIDVRQQLPQPPVIELSVAKTNRLLGTDLEKAEIKSLLQSIEFEIADKDDDLLTVTPPSFRVDVSRPEDLMEEVARRWGYNRIPVTFPIIPAFTPTVPPLRTQRQRLSAILTGLGFSEIINYSFVHRLSSNRLRLNEQDPRTRQLAVLNPLSEDQSVMRTSLVPGLLETMRRNLAHQSRDLKIFEIGKTFISRGSDHQPEEIEMLAGLWTGDRSSGGWYGKAEACDFYDLKGSVEGLLQALHVRNVKFQRQPADQCTYTHPGTTAQIVSDGQMIGIIGEIHPQVLNTYELKQTAFIFEMDRVKLSNQIPHAVYNQPLPRYPATTRDATLIIDNNLEADVLLEQIRQMQEPLVEEVRLFDVFAGPPITQGRKSVSLRVTYRSPDATLEDNIVNDLHTRLMAHIIDKFKADLPV